MTALVRLEPLDRAGIRWAQGVVTAQHYLHTPVDARCSVEGYAVHLAAVAAPVGLFLVGRPEATKLYPWYGSVADVATGRAAATRWEVLNLARVWFDPTVQPGGACYQEGTLPGFRDRRGVWRSGLASAALGALAARVGFDYLIARPPCFIEEPYLVRWLLSYQDSRRHKGTIYRVAGFERYRENKRGLVTWRLPLPPLTPAQDALVRARAATNLRSIRLRARRGSSANVRQPALFPVSIPF